MNDEGGRPPYQPPRRKTPETTGLPLEIDLVFGVRPCGTCSFFWPDDPNTQPYGPYPSFDFSPNFPITPEPAPDARTFPWLKGRTRLPTFPDPEVMDGCRKAPIMTIGINPNLTAFAPGPTGASWTYPSFGSEDGTDEWAKYAYYYRYRSVYQERFDLDFVKQFLLPDSRVVAARDGVFVSADRKTSAPNFQLKVRYDGDLNDTVIPLERALGTPRWVVFVNAYPPNNQFKAGTVLAARLDVPAGQDVQVHRDQVGYYEQFVPVLSQFQALVRSQGNPDAELSMGEDVCQLDMVACASPHWGPDWLGFSMDSEQTIIKNCVSSNAWAMKQLVQTKPAVLFLVGEASYNMFHGAFGGLIERDPPLSRRPADNAFTLLRETTDRSRPCYFRFETTIDGIAYSLRTRLVITPHFSYNSNFDKQFRLSPSSWSSLQASQPAFCAQLMSDKRVTYVPGSKPEDYIAFVVKDDLDGLLADLEAISPDATATLKADYYDAHQMMADVLADLYGQGALRYGPVGDGSVNALGRTEGSCRFCVNDRWQFPQGCPYGKPDEPPPPAGFLDKVTAALVAAGRTSHS